MDAYSWRRGSLTDRPEYCSSPWPVTDPIFNTVYTYTFVALRTIFLSHSKLIDGNQPLPRVGILFQDIAYGIRYAEMWRDEGTIWNDIHRWKWIKKWPFGLRLHAEEGLGWFDLKSISTCFIETNDFKKKSVWKCPSYRFGKHRLKNLSFFFLAIRNITLDFCNINFELVRKLDGIVAKVCEIFVTIQRETLARLRRQLVTSC